GSDGRVLRVGRANTPKLAADSSSAPNKKVSVSSHVERSPLRRIGNADRSLPRCSAVSRTTESSELASEGFGPKLVVTAVAHAAGSPINGEPFLVAAVCASIG